MLETNQLPNVMDMVCDIGQGRSARVLAVDVLGIERDHYDASVRLQHPEHVIRNVAGMGAQGEARRVRKEHGCFARVESHAHGRGARVGQVNHHPDPVHLQQKQSPGRGETAVQGPGWGRAVGVLVMAVVCQGDVAHSQSVVHSHDAGAVADLV